MSTTYVYQCTRGRLGYPHFTDMGADGIEGYLRLGSGFSRPVCIPTYLLDLSTYLRYIKCMHVPTRTCYVLVDTSMAPMGGCCTGGAHGGEFGAPAGMDAQADPTWAVARMAVHAGALCLRRSDEPGSQVWKRPC